MTDELRDRLARIDPMPPDVATVPLMGESSRDRLERVMSTQTKKRPAPNKTWMMTIAAAVVLIAAIGGGLALMGDTGETAPQASPALQLNAGDGGDALASCIMFSVGELARMDVAFEGTVTAVDGPTVSMSVDEWFKGGDAEQVVLNAPQGMEALIGGISFTRGERYLITAHGTNVNYCGFSGPSTPEFRAAFEEAFGD